MSEDGAHEACSRRIEHGVVHYACGVSVGVGTYAGGTYSEHVRRANGGFSRGPSRVDTIAEVLRAHRITEGEDWVGDYFSSCRCGVKDVGLGFHHVAERIDAMLGGAA